MKAVAKVRSRNPGLRYLLHEHLARKEPARSLKVVHASDLTRCGREEFCPRERCLMMVRGYKPPARLVSTSEQVTFRIGREIQDAVVHWLADMGRAVTNWACHSCRQMHEFGKRPVKCHNCGTRAFEPREVRFVSKESGASCGVDVLVDLGEPRLIAVEVKTIKDAEFRKLEAPLAEHRLRTNLYLRIIDEAGAKSVNTRKGIVLYVCKGGYGIKEDAVARWGLDDRRFSPFKEFPVARDDDRTERLVRKARAVQAWRDSHAGMPYGVCQHILDTRAEHCSMAEVCFSGEHPPEQAWEGSHEGDGP